MTKTRANIVMSGLTLILFAAHSLQAEEAINLWPVGSRELNGVEAQHIPALYSYPVPQAEQKTPAVLICPAGGYKHHSDSSRQVQWLNGLGVAVYVVKYRLPVHGYKHPAPLHDAQRAMRIIKQNAESWGLDASKIGVLGGSSGGHLASTLATHYDEGDEFSADPVERHGCRPHFVILSDAVITMQGKACHFYSRGRLLPADPPQQLVDSLSNELQVTPETAAHISRGRGARPTGPRGQ